MINYTLTDSETSDGFMIIRLDEGKFKDVEFHYTEVSFSGDDVPILNFSYNLVSGEMPDGDVKDFQELIFNILISIIETQIESNEVVYSGGVDETI